MSVILPCRTASSCLFVLLCDFGELWVFISLVLINQNNKNKFKACSRPTTPMFCKVKSLLMPKEPKYSVHLNWYSYHCLASILVLPFSLGACWLLVANRLTIDKFLIQPTSNTLTYPFKGEHQKKLNYLLWLHHLLCFSVQDCDLG